MSHAVLENLKSPHDLKGKSVLVLGAGGVTGLALVETLSDYGARVFATDQMGVGALSTRLHDFIEHSERVTAIDYHPEAVKKLSADFALVSPGIPLTDDTVKAVANANVALLGDLEFAAHFLNCPIVSVTGTNGKTTVCTLIADMLRRFGKRCFLGGNIGRPLIYAVNDHWDIVVCEVSSFQLEKSTIASDVAVFLNITEDHLDRHGSFEEYLACKASLFETLTEDDFAIGYLGNRHVKNILSALTRPKILGYTDGAEDASVKVVDNIIDVQFPGAPSRFHLGSMRLRGRHNALNMAALVAVGKALGVDDMSIQDTIDNAAAPPHRMEDLGFHHGVRFINDSKSTTLDSTRNAIASFQESVTLILGGRNKGADFKLLNEDIANSSVAWVMAYGECAAEIAEAIQAVPVKRFIKFEDAVRDALLHTKEGGVVLLSPAASSLDQFENFEARGDKFKEVCLEG